MSKVFQVKPKRLKRSNGTALTPDMVVRVTTMQHTATPFYNGAKEVQEAYMRMRVCHKSVTHPFLFFAFSQIRNL